jgi:hypothetical protein
MSIFKYVVEIDTDTAEHANEVMANRLNWEEQLFEVGDGTLTSEAASIEGEPKEVEYSISDWYEK